MEQDTWEMCSHVLGFMWQMFCKVRRDCLIFSIFKRETWYHQFMYAQPFQSENNLFTNQKVLPAAFKYFGLLLFTVCPSDFHYSGSAKCPWSWWFTGRKQIWPWYCCALAVLGWVTGTSLERWTRKVEATLCLAAADCNAKPPFTHYSRRSLDRGEELDLFLREFGFMIKTKWVLSMETYLQDETVIISEMFAV